uniref:Ion_trans domain-containing protein n=1 Tax=Heterorhabditis bacteriophora TaxID=37862 RepID=A0A1I7XIG3_HETBA
MSHVFDIMWTDRKIWTSTGGIKSYFFKASLEFLSNNSETFIADSLAKFEEEIGVKNTAELEKLCTASHPNSDPIAAYISGFSHAKPSTEKILATYMPMAEMDNKSLEICFVDLCLMFGHVDMAKSFCARNKIQHDLWMKWNQQFPDQDSNIWEISRAAVSVDLINMNMERSDSADLTRFICEWLAGSATRKMAVIAEMFAWGLKWSALKINWDALVLACICYPDHEITEIIRTSTYDFLKDICPNILEIMGTSSGDQQTKRCKLLLGDLVCSSITNKDNIYQLNCYRLNKVDLARNEKKERPLEDKLVSRVELLSNIRCIILYSMARRDFSLSTILAMDASKYLDKYGFFCDLQQIVFQNVISMVNDIVQVIFYLMSDKSELSEIDSSNSLGNELLGSNNGNVYYKHFVLVVILSFIVIGILGGLIYHWMNAGIADQFLDDLRRSSITAVINSLINALEHCDINQRDKGMIHFSLDLAFSIVEISSGKEGKSLEEIARNNTELDYNVAILLIKELVKEILNSIENYLQQFVDRERSETPIAADLESSETPIAADLESSETPIAADLESSETPIAADLERSKTPIAVDLERSETPIAADLERSETPIAADLERSETPIAADLERSETPIAADLERSETPIAADLERSETPIAADLEYLNRSQFCVSSSSSDSISFQEVHHSEAFTDVNQIIQPLAVIIDEICDESDQFVKEPSSRGFACALNQELVSITHAGGGDLVENADTISLDENIRNDNQATNQKIDVTEDSAIHSEKNDIIANSEKNVETISSTSIPGPEICALMSQKETQSDFHSGFSSGGFENCGPSNFGSFDSSGDFTRGGYASNIGGGRGRISGRVYDRRGRPSRGRLETIRSGVREGF